MEDWELTTATCPEGIVWDDVTHTHAISMHQNVEDSGEHIFIMIDLSDLRNVNGIFNFVRNVITI